MLDFKHFTTEFARRFFAPLAKVYPQSIKPYACHTLSDLDFAALGIARCLSHASSGHEFLQHHIDQGQQGITVDHFFKSLRSERRLKNLRSLNDELMSVMTARLSDPFTECPELKNFEIYAADGHYQKAACFDGQKQRKEALKNPKLLKWEGKVFATGHFFRLNLRSHHLSHLALCQPEDGKKKEHDMAAIKRVGVEGLRYSAPPGRKVIYAWDKACVGYEVWGKYKRKGIYFITQEKSNSAMKQIGVENWDRDDPRNEGVVSDYYVGNSNGETLRRIVYTDPRDGKTYTYLTNELTLPPCALVLIYKLRWDVEKVFDELECKMNEAKSWASADEAKMAHGIFQSLAHNLMLLLEHGLKNQGLSDEVEKKKMAGRQAAIRNREGEKLKEGRNFINVAVTRATQRTVRFIRWLRASLYRQAPWRAAVERLREIWGQKC